MVSPAAPDVEDTQQAVHQALVEGKIRAKLNWRLLTRAESTALTDTRWGDVDNPYALPSDLKLSVEDAERIWAGRP